MASGSKMIIYDDDCPLCSAYTSAFVRSGLIDAQNRKCFSTVEPGVLSLVDVARSVNEIPVIDADSKEVWYGVDALLEILGTRFPFVKQIGNLTPMRWFLQRLYKLISYNRRVIVAAQPSTVQFDCTPDFNVCYRIFFLLISLLFTSLLLFPLHSQVFSHSFFGGLSVRQLHFAHTGMVLINIAIAVTLPRKDAFEYLGQATMLALTAVLLAVPMVIPGALFHYINPVINNFYLGTVGLCLMIDYRRRMRAIGIATRYPLIVAINIASVLSMFLYLIFVKNQS